MRPDEGGGSPWLALLRACAAAAPLFVLLYYTDARFHDQVDGYLRTLQEARYRARLRSWYARVWEPMEAWQREAWEQRYGPPPRRG